MSLSRGRKRVRINGALLSRAQTITFERQQTEKECFTAADGKTRCKNENKGTFFNRSKFIEPKDAKPTKEDTLKSIQEVESECWIAASGNKICKNDKGRNVNITTGRTANPIFSLDFIKDLPSELGRSTANFRQSITGEIKDIGDDPLKATISFKDRTVNWILTNENKFRAAKVLGDALSLGLIAVGSIVLAVAAPTGVGAVVGGAIVAGGVGLGAVSTGLGKGIDAAVLTARRIQQLENAVEVARQSLTIPVDRQALIDENEEAITARQAELVDMLKTELTTKAGELELKGTSLMTKSDLAREIAIQEIIGDAGREIVEPKVGKSLIDVDTAFGLKKITEKQIDRNEKIKQVQDFLGVDLNEAKTLVRREEIQAEIEKEQEAERKRQAKIKKDVDEAVKIGTGKTRPEILAEEEKRATQILAKQEQVRLIQTLLGVSEEKAEELLVAKEKAELQAKEDKRLKEEEELRKQLDRILRAEFTAEEIAEDKRLLRVEEEKQFQLFKKLKDKKDRTKQEEEFVQNVLRNTRAADARQVEEDKFKKALADSENLTRMRIELGLEPEEFEEFLQEAFPFNIDDIIDEDAESESFEEDRDEDDEKAEILDDDDISVSTFDDESSSVSTFDDGAPLPADLDKSPLFPSSQGRPIVSTIGETKGKKKSPTTAGLDITEEGDEEKKEERTILTPDEILELASVDKSREDRMRELQQQLRTTTSEKKKKTIRELILNLRGLRPADQDSPAAQIAQFDFTELSNQELIDQTSRKKVQNAFKENKDAGNPTLFKKAKFFSTPGDITPAMFQSGNLPVDRDNNALRGVALANALTIETNNLANINIYKAIQRRVAEAKSNGECMEYLRQNKATIALLPQELKDELHSFCESILDDDVEEI